MTISVKFFASLRDTLNLDQVNIDFKKGQTVQDIWNSATNNRTPPNNILCSINLEHCDFEQAINNNDEVAFFPPVTGG